MTSQSGIVAATNATLGQVTRAHDADPSEPIGDSRRAGGGVDPSGREADHAEAADRESVRQGDDIGGPVANGAGRLHVRAADSRAVDGDQPNSGRCRH